MTSPSALKPTASVRVARGRRCGRTRGTSRRDGDGVKRATMSSIQLCPAHARTARAGSVTARDASSVRSPTRAMRSVECARGMRGVRARDACEGARAGVVVRRDFDARVFARSVRACARVRRGEWCEGRTRAGHRVWARARVRRGPGQARRRWILALTASFSRAFVCASA